MANQRGSGPRLQLMRASGRSVRRSIIPEVETSGRSRGRSPKQELEKRYGAVIQKVFRRLLQEVTHQTARSVRKEVRFLLPREGNTETTFFWTKIRLELPLLLENDPSLEETRWIVRQLIGRLNDHRYGYDASLEQEGKGEQLVIRCR